MQTDREVAVEAEVRRALTDNEYTRAADVAVSVDRGVVTLRGTAPSFAVREAAEAAALALPDVFDVVDEIEVQPDGEANTPSEDIAANVRRTLEAHFGAAAGNVKSVVSHGVVALHGSVGSWQSAAGAEEAVIEVPGVQDVMDEMVVRSPARGRALEADVEDALKYHAGHPLRGIEVGVEDGEVVLTGPIRSWAERDEVLEVVRHTPGVRSIKDHLYLRGFRTSW